MAPKKKKPVKAAKKPKNAPATQLAKCNTKNICEYLQQLSDYLVQFNADYKKLRVAVCNLDHQVFGSGGNLAKRFCTGGTSAEPADPPPTPVW